MDRLVIIKIIRDLFLASEDISNVIIDFCQTPFIDAILCNGGKYVRIPNYIIGVIEGHYIFKELVAKRSFWFRREKTKKSGDIIYLISSDKHDAIIKTCIKFTSWHDTKNTHTINQTPWVIDIEIWNFGRLFRGTIIINTN